MISGRATPTSFDHGISNFEDVKGLTRDRPWLLPTNRKLRHLQGISLRNLSLNKTRGRPYGKTIDDESLPYAFKSPVKLLAQSEIRKLEHSKSSSDLTQTPSRQNGKQKEVEVPQTPQRPPGASMRRRSTLNWFNESPKQRQIKLEQATDQRMADTWFSIHCPGKEEPVYISEQVPKSMNPSFRFFDLNTYGPLVTRQDELIIKFWAKTENAQEYIHLIELDVHLGSLQFIGKSLESFHHPLPQNCIIFHLSDGIYTSFTDLPYDDPVPLSATFPSKTSSPAFQSTSSFDALMRLSNLDDCIQDALATREKLTSQIESILVETRGSRDTVSAVSAAQERLASVQRSVLSTRRAYLAVQRRKAEIQESIAARRSAMEKGRKSQREAEAHYYSMQDDIPTLEAQFESVRLSINGQVRRTCEDLATIYPIEPMHDKQFSFTIRGLHLPNANFFSNTNSASEATTAAALGMVSHVQQLLSIYLATPLPYPITPYGSMSTIYDPITISLSAQSQSQKAINIIHSQSNNPGRVFPLYQSSSIQYRFEYGVFLLNTDLELLMWKRGLRMVDQRQTLANLKYLLVVLGTGRGEIPGRKRGVIGALRSVNSFDSRDGSSEDGDGRDMDNENGSNCVLRIDSGVWKGKGKERASPVISAGGNGGLTLSHSPLRTAAFMKHGIL